MIDLSKTLGEKRKLFLESSRVLAKQNDPYNKSFIDSFLTFPDPPNIVEVLLCFCIITVYLLLFVTTNMQYCSSTLFDVIIINNKISM